MKYLFLSSKPKKIKKNLLSGVCVDKTGNVGRANITGALA